MPVIVIGADTSSGEAVIDALLPRDGEVRAFVTDIDVGIRLKERGVKVAIGDISDGSHVGAATLNAFCAIVIGEAAIDDRERSFAGDPDAVVAAWIEGLVDAGAKRIVVVDHPDVPIAALRRVTDQVVVIDGRGRPEDIATEAARLEAASAI